MTEKQCSRSNGGRSEINKPNSLEDSDEAWPHRQQDHQTQKTTFFPQHSQGKTGKYFLPLKRQACLFSFSWCPRCISMHIYVHKDLLTSTGIRAPGPSQTAGKSAQFGGQWQPQSQDGSLPHPFQICFIQPTELIETHRDTQGDTIMQRNTQ